MTLTPGMEVVVGQDDDFRPCIAHIGGDYAPNVAVRLGSLTTGRAPREIIT